MLLNLLVGSQSHKCGSLCFKKFTREESLDLNLARGHVSKLILEVALDLGLNLL